MPLELYNTLTKRKEPFVPRDPGHVTFYTCGPTVYDDAHIGNFRSFLAADLLRRWIESPLCELSDGRGGVHQGPRRVTHVMNITDVGHMTDDAEGGETGEDRMAVAGRRLAEAKKAGKIPAGVNIDPNDPYQIARFYEERFREDAVKLGLKVSMEARTDPTLHPRATDHIEGMKAVIARLIKGNFAYVVGEPGSRVVYFDVRSFAAYGRLSGNTLDKLREGQGGRVSAENQSQKRHPADFLLWKEDPSHIMKWESPWGAGYPGWHIECTVMSIGRLLFNKHGDANAEGMATQLRDWLMPDSNALIDLHSGGEDNIFPHHECEIAQTCCAFNQTPQGGTFSRMWFHPRFLLVEGTKMSKSKGNFYTPRDLFAKGIEPAAIRLELIKTHYRTNANFTMQGLTDSQRMIERWRQVLTKEPDALRSEGRAMLAEDAERAFVRSMNDDLNIAGAIGAINSWVNPRLVTAEDRQILRRFDSVLGVLLLEERSSTTTSIGVFAPGVDVNPEVEAKLAERRDARAAKDFGRSDAIRDQLAAMGYAIKDMPGGKVEVRRA